MAMTPDEQSGALSDFAKLVLANAEQTNDRLSEVERNERSLPSEWWRYILSAIFAGLLAWGVVQSKINVTENNVNYHSRQIEELREENKYLRQSIRELEREVDRYHNPSNPR